ncbi:MAG: hypothetical protein ACE5FT_01125 [Candidatus Nanoarchaeia archaeon]
MRKLSEYIKRCLAEGHDLHRVRRRLLMSGYTSLEVDECVQEAMQPKVNMAPIYLLLIVGFGLFIVLRTPGDVTGHAIAPVEPIVCESPYMRYGDGCCLDLDSNAICDKDKVEKAVPEVKDVEDVEIIEPFEFKSGSVVASREGYSLSIGGFEYEVYGTWGKVKIVNFSITNKGDHAISPIVAVNVHTKDWNDAPRSPLVQLETTLEPGEFLVSNSYVDVSFSDMEKLKTLELTLKDANTFPPQPLVNVQKDFMPKS